MWLFFYNKVEEGRWKKEEGRRKMEEGRGKDCSVRNMKNKSHPLRWLLIG